MNKGKILIVSIAALVIIVLGYFLFKIFKPEPDNYFKIVLIDKSIDSNQISLIADEILKLSKGQNINLSISLSGKTFDNNIIITAFAVPNALNKSIVDFINNSLNKFNINNSNPNESANNQIEELARVLSNIKDYTTVFIAGKFPNCYDKENSEKALNILKKNLTIKDSSLIEINWMLQSNSEEPESILLDYLKNSGITFNNNQITVAKRVCTSSSRNVFSVFFNPLDSSDVISFEKFLSTNFGKNVNLKIWNDSKINDRIISSNQNAQFQASDRKILNELSKGQWTSIGYLIKQATNEFAAMHDSVKKDLIIVAPLPLENKGKEIDPSVWKTLSTIKNLNVYYIYPGKVNLSLVDKAFKGGFKKNNINISEIKL